MQQNNCGFTLIELLIAIAVIGILTSLAIPSYQNYTRKAHFAEVVQAMTPFKLGVEECFQSTGELKGCQSGKNGVPKNIEAGTGVNLIDSVITSDNGVITATPRNLYGIKITDTYILTPSTKNNQLVWTSSGGGVEEGYAH